MHVARWRATRDVAGAASALIAAALACATPARERTPLAPFRPVVGEELAGWAEIRGSRFSLTTDVDRSTAQAFASELELFIALLNQVTGLVAQREEPLQIFLFATSSDFVRYRLEPHQVGVFFSDGPRSFALMSGSGPWVETRQMIFHEFTHYLMSASAAVRAYPLWYSEGLAELLSSVHWEGPGAIIGLPPARLPRARALGRWIPLEHLLAATTTSSMSLEDTDLFYAEAWALVHYLHTAKQAAGRDRYPQMLDYLQQVRGGSDWQEAAGRAFGAPLEDLEVELHQHWTTPAQQLLVLRVDRGRLAPAASGEVRALLPAEVDARLADLAAAIAARGAATGLDPPVAGPVEPGPEPTPSRAVRPWIDPADVEFPRIELQPIEASEIDAPDLRLDGEQHTN